MSNQFRVPSLDDHRCQICSSTSSINNEKRLSCFSCDHCHLSMCYDCFEKHTSQLIDEFTQLQTRFSQLTNLFHEKRQFLATFQEHCVRNVNSAFDEVVHDLENLRRESINYVKQQFNDTEIIISEMINNVKPLIAKAQQTWTTDGITKNVMLEVGIQRSQISEIEQRLEIFSSPDMQIKLSTYPRNKIDLYCQLLLSSYASTKKFSPNHPGKILTTRCASRRGTKLQTEKIDVDQSVEELNPNAFSNQQTQTEPVINSNHVIDDVDEDFYSQDATKDNCLSTRLVQQGTILTQNEVDRIASDGESLLYFSDTSKSLCYITNIISTRQANSTSITEEISCRWPYHPILDIVYSPSTYQFVCATKVGVYTCTIHKSTIDIQPKLTQHWTYVRLSADKVYIWLWTDTPRSNQLRAYSPRTFECIKMFNLNDYPRFSDNSTSFCIHTNILATLFQFKELPNIISYRKNFHLTLCDSTDLHELCTIRVGECDIDHEIRVNEDGLYFITDGKRKLWIVDGNGKKEYVHLYRTGRALTIYNTNQVIIANGTQHLQCIELL